MTDSSMAVEPDMTDTTGSNPSHPVTLPNPHGSPTPVPAPVLSPVDRAIARLQDSNVAFNTPPTMALAEVSEVEVVLSRNESPAALSAEVHAPGAHEVHPVKVSSRMEARLTSPGFTILAMGPEVQATSATEPTRWRWNVRAAEEGDQQLHLTLTAFIDVDGNTTPRMINSFDHTIRVKVTTKQRVAGFVGNNWQWLWTVIVAPLGAAAVAWWKRKKPSDAGTA